ncbi:ADC synthase [Mycena albidolilacea]|uniref:aminodeoxychorismate synthase n=1 Tax=Mycena albidolilacea TaxID=1033008 RepID=A0AAD7AN24_9AGAR|nr:ADC synthase [Mycena albidolilacea]
MAIGNPRLLLVDSYDSFTFNLASLCKQCIPNCTIYIVKNDRFSMPEIAPLLSSFSAVIVGPGPGSPENDHDVGVIKDLWNIPEKSTLPIFGVCLGLQSLGVAYGAQLKRLDVVKHGQISQIHHTGVELFHGVGRVEAVRYHSLHVALANGGDVEELAWADDGAENGRVVMAIRHASRPYWAVQYHPESVCTRGGGLEVIQNFWRLAQAWSIKTRRQIQPWNTNLENMLGKPWQSYPLASPVRPTLSQSRPSVATQVCELPTVTAATVSELFGVRNEASPFVLLDSAAQPGRFSIIASLMPTSLQITHFAGDDFLTLTWSIHSRQERMGPGRDVWTWIASFMAGKRVHDGHPDIPFWGGLVGVLSYELGVRSLDVAFNKETHVRRHPDLNLVFVERSVVIDSATGRVFVQSIIPNDDPWISDTVSMLTEASPTEVLPILRPELSPLSPVVALPDKSRYIARIHEAKERIFAGDSYELCLTARTSISVPKSKSLPASLSTSWDRYQGLRSKNPAPYSAYIRLHPTTLLSSSPERFLSTSRPPNPIFQLRPIKGTVRKAPGITRAVAEEALIGSIKEVAENLMIVDLIRHDLHAVVGEDVQVKQFCGVEEYETVWQLVSVIEGTFKPGTSGASDSDTQLGWEMLRTSLPPGSMTGAPKKRSIEILQTLEDQDRSIYSGVFGYWCLGGGSDWSVTIRSCFKFEDRSNAASEDCNSFENWHIGAGGAITALSDPEAEWEEMITKLKSVVGAFGA